MVGVSRSAPSPVVRSVTQQLMDTEAETHCQTLGRATRTPQKREGESLRDGGLRITASRINYEGLRRAQTEAAIMGPVLV